MEVSDSLINAAIQATVARVWKGLTWKGQLIGLLIALAFAFSLPLIAYANWIHPWLFGESFARAVPHFAAVGVVLILTYFMARWLATATYLVLIPGGKIEAAIEDLYRKSCKEFYPDFDVEDAHKRLKALPAKERLYVLKTMARYVVLDFLGSDTETLRSILQARAAERRRLSEQPPESFVDEDS